MATNNPVFSKIMDFDNYEPMDICITSVDLMEIGDDNDEAMDTC